jgi:hypothetical protein
MTVKMPTLRDRWIASCLALVFLAPAPGVAQTQPEAAQTQQQAAQEPLPPNTNPAQHVVYPAQGQSQDQALSDQLKAYRWATQQTNWDPYKAYDQLAEQGYVSKRNAEEAQGGGVRGAAGGALAGLAIGAIAGDAGKGAAIGAVAGGLTGGIRSRRKQQAAQAEMDQAVDAFKRQFSLWDRNYVACLQGLGYTVT